MNMLAGLAQQYKINDLQNLSDLSCLVLSSAKHVVCLFCPASMFLICCGFNKRTTIKHDQHHYNIQQYNKQQTATTTTIIRVSTQAFSNKYSSWGAWMPPLTVFYFSTLCNRNHNSSKRSNS